MVQFELFNIDNPCVGVCQTNAKGYCIGCLRSRTERLYWHKMTCEQQRQVLKLLYQRQKRLAQKDGQDRQLALELDSSQIEPLF